VTTMRIPPEQKKALYWIKEHQPTPWSHQAPTKRVIFKHLLSERLIEMHRSRARRTDPVTFVLSPAGKRALEGSDGKEAS